jgi:SAM-dependent methyltransferase
MSLSISLPSFARRHLNREPAISAYPNDGYSFDQLARSYNFERTSDDRLILSNLICRELDSLTGTRRVIDIGCGRGIGLDDTFQRRIAGRTQELWGIEPDPSIRPGDGIFTHFQHALLETASIPENSFDVAYSFMVMEHVTDPKSFLRAVHRCLKPGGAYYFLTPNGRHYFVKAAAALRLLKADEFVLRALRGRDVDQYHYPTMYRCNTPEAIASLAAETGFGAPRFAFLEREGPRPYMPGPLRPLFHALRWKRRVLRDPQLLLSLVAQLRKPKPASLAA